MPSKLWLFMIHKGTHSNPDDKLADEPLSRPSDSYAFLMTGSKTNRPETHAAHVAVPPASRYDLPRLSFCKLLWLQIIVVSLRSTTFAGGSMWKMRAAGSEITTQLSPSTLRRTYYPVTQPLASLSTKVWWKRFPKKPTNIRKNHENITLQQKTDSKFLKPIVFQFRLYLKKNLRKSLDKLFNMYILETFFIVYIVLELYFEISDFTIC